MIRQAAALSDATLGREITVTGTLTGTYALAGTVVLTLKVAGDADVEVLR